MYMSIHTQEEMTTFADTECSSMRAYFHHLQSLFQLISFSTSCAITAVPKHHFFPLSLHLSMSFTFLLILQL